MGSIDLKEANTDIQACRQVDFFLLFICLQKNRNKGDASNYSTYPDSTELPKPIKPADDPFINWWNEWIKMKKIEVYSL